ncbi:MAG: sensor histidine kinase, partial [Desulfamplus sp.]|nr:sensor histidine kinase [Desulfamplus sp.]
MITEKTVASHQQSIAAEAAKTVTLWLKQQMKIIDATAVTVQQSPIQEDPYTLRILRMAMEAGNFSDVYIGLIDGTMIDGASWIPPKGYDPRTRPWYHKAMTDQTTSFTTPYQDMTTGKMVIAIVRPLWVQNNASAESDSSSELSTVKHTETIKGIISGDIILNTLEENVMNVKIGKSGYTFIIDGQGTVLIHPDHNKQMKEKIQDADPTLKGIMDIFSRTSSGSYTYKYFGEEKILSYQRLPDSGWYLCTTIQKEEAYTLAKNTAMLFAMGVVFKILGLITLLTILLAVCSGAVVLISKQRLATIVKKHKEVLSVKEMNLKGEISRRKEVETRYWTMFNVATNAILIIKNNLYIECNQKSMELFELDHKDIIGKTMLELSPANQQDGEDSKVKLEKLTDKLTIGIMSIANKEITEDILIENRERKDNMSLFFEWTFMRSNGTEFPAEVSLKSVLLDREEVTLCSIWDISRRTNAEQRLRQSQKMAAMGEMLSVIAHQWRQPLNVLSSYIASLTPAFYNDMITKGFIEKVVVESDSQIQFMSRTINDFRDYFKPSKSKQSFNIYECVRSAIKLMEPQLKKSRINFSILISEHLQIKQDIDQAKHNDSQVRCYEIHKSDEPEAVMVFGYKNEFVHVLVNIISNARDAIEEKAEQNDRGIEITIARDNNLVSLAIDDTGCGIPDHLIPKIFTPYFTTKGTSTGTGIGLYMAKMIVEKEMQGTILAENHLNG